MPKFDIRKYIDFKSVVALISGLTVLIGSTLGVHAYFAKEKEFVSFKNYIESRVAGGDVNLLIYDTSASKSAVQSDIWKTEDRIQSKPNDDEAKKRLRELNAEKTKLDQREQELKAEKIRLEQQQKQNK